jgi:membrane associated rhomboid family serine protease
MSAGEPRTPPAATTFRTAPVALLCTIAALVLFALAWDFDRRHPGDRFGGKGRHGALTVLVVTVEPQLKGLFQLWGDRWYDGEWWRLLTTGFHHGDPLHLLLNGFGMIYLGRLLEPRLGSVKFLLLFFTAIVVANVPHVAMSEGAVGLSGGLYALFGALLTLRRTDDEVAEKLSDAVVLVVLLWIPVGMLLTANDVLQIGNAAHLTGLIYGWLAGRAIFASRQKRRWFTPRVFVAAHALVIPAIVLAAHPPWNGRYHWYRALQTDDPSERVARLEAAVDRNPRLAGAWRYLAEFHRRRNADDEKWQAALQGVKWCPADEKNLAYVNHLWHHTSSEDRRRGLTVLRELFPQRESEMRRQLGLFISPMVPAYRPMKRYLARVYRNAPVPYVPRGPDFFWPPVDGRRVATPEPLRAPSIDPDHPDSAALGRLL